MNAMSLMTRVTDHRPVAYFTVRLDVRPNPAGNPSLTGTVERLGTGDKRRFVTADELVRLLSEWQSALATPASTQDRADAH